MVFKVSFRQIGEIFSNQHYKYLNYNYSSIRKYENSVSYPLLLFEHGECFITRTIYKNLDLSVDLMERFRSFLRMTCNSEGSNTMEGTVHVHVLCTVDYKYSHYM